MPPNPLIVAHRGASRDAPENTIAAFKLAWEQGADVIEGDFHLAPDGRVICVHDFDPAKDAGKAFPTLSEVLATVPQGKGIFIEVKCGPEILTALLEVLDQESVPTGNVTVIAFNPAVIRQLKKRNAAIRAHWLTKLKRGFPGFRLKPDPETLLTSLEQIGADGVGLQAHRGLTPAFIRQIRDAGYPVHVWTVDDPTFARSLAGMGVASITTNIPGAMRRALQP